MDTQQALLRAILLSPDDDTARLVYADWLEENGDEQSAQAIRWHVSNPHPFVRDSQAGRWRTKKRIRPSPPAHFWNYLNRFLSGPMPAVSVNRGFAWSASMPLKEFMEQAAALFSAHPITAVTLTDRLALSVGLIANSVYRVWFRDDTVTQSMWPNFRNYLPATIFDRLTGGDLTRNSPGVAELRRYPVYQFPHESDLSQACVAYGRSLAGLPPLTGTGAGSPE